jgi:hypothetical protein
MKNKFYFFSLMFLIIVVLYIPASYSQPTFDVILANDAQPAPNIYEFDIYLLRTGSTPFELGGFQLGILYNDAAKNGGTLTVGFIPGSADPSVQACNIQNTNFNTTTPGCIKSTVKYSGGAGNGAIISNVAPGTKFGRLRLTNSKIFDVQKANITWSFALPYFTRIYYYVGSSSVEITANGTFINTLDNSLLPVELSSFTSDISGRNVNLKWSTLTEKNSNKFLVERKTIKADWQFIASINAAVLSNSPKEYSFSDRNLDAGKYQYRLKMVDNDGTFEYSKIIETEVTAPKNFDLSQNYPNPFNPQTKINYTLPFESKVTLEVYNITGERITELVNEEQPAGYYSVDFGASKLSSGVYIYRLVASDKATGNNFSSVKKMMLLK